ncbi:MAG: hypothetical protein ACKPCM_15705 [Pseudanabaena sp.]
MPSASSSLGSASGSSVLTHCSVWTSWQSCLMSLWAATRVSAFCWVVGRTSWAIRLLAEPLEAGLFSKKLKIYCKLLRIEFSIIFSEQI